MFARQSYTSSQNNRDRSADCSAQPLENEVIVGQPAGMLSTYELRALLRQRKIKGGEVATVLGVTKAVVSRIYSGKRPLKLDEARRLIEHFKLTETSPGSLSPLTLPVSRLLILYLGNRLGVKIDPDDPRLAELAQDFRSFSIFALDPRLGESTEAVEGFLQGLRLKQNTTWGAKSYPEALG